MFLFFFQGDVKPAMMAISNLATRGLDPTTDDEVRGLYEFNQFSTLCLVFFKTSFPMFPCLIFSPFCTGSFLQYVGGLSSVVYAILLLSVSHLNFIMFFSCIGSINKQNLLTIRLGSDCSVNEPSELKVTIVLYPIIGYYIFFIQGSCYKECCWTFCFKETYKPRQGKTTVWQQR